MVADVFMGPRESRCQCVDSSMNQRARFSRTVSRQPDGHLLQHTHTACDLTLATARRTSYVGLIPTTMESGPAKGCT